MNGRSPAGRTAAMLLVLLLILCLVSGCGSGRKTGTVTGVKIEDGEIAVVVKLDDGSEVTALRGEALTPKITGGQKVEIERLDSNRWKVVRVLDSIK